VGWKPREKKRERYLTNSPSKKRCGCPDHWLHFPRIRHDSSQQRVHGWVLRVPQQRIIMAQILSHILPPYSWPAILRTLAGVMKSRSSLWKNEPQMMRHRGRQMSYALRNWISRLSKTRDQKRRLSHAERESDSKVPVNVFR